MARTKIDPMTKSNKKPITVKPIEADSVITTTLLQDFIALHGGSMLDAGLRFSDAHMELRIILKADKGQGLGWITTSEAEQITAHMEAHATEETPSITKWL